MVTPHRSLKKHVYTDINYRDGLTASEKSAYINATLCLQKTPAKSGIKGAVTLWDELQYAHVAVSAH
jgi:hypothetical protein